MTDRTIERQMDPLDLLTNEELLFFFHRKKTEISCIEQPHRLLTQLRDHDLVPEKLFETMIKIRSPEQKEKRFYVVLDWLEKNRPQDINQFWSCVFEDHILTQYPTLRILRNNLLEIIESKGKAEKGQEKSYTGKRKKDEKTSEDNIDPHFFSAFTPKRRKPDKKPSFCTSNLFEKPPDVETLKEEEESKGKVEKGKDKSYTRKRSKDDRSSEDSDDPGPSSTSTPKRRKPDTKPSFSSPMKKEDKKEMLMLPVHEAQLPVTCGHKEGTLYRNKLSRVGEKCILSHGRWFTPADFEKFAGKEKCKNWKSSIRCRNMTLKKLIEEGHLQCPQRKNRKKTCVQKNMNKRFPVSSNKSSSAETSSSLMEESDAEDFQEQGGRSEGTEFRGRVEEEEEVEEDMADLSVFQAPSLPVTCVSLTGTLYKYRFASGSRGKCIRTEEKWFTPEEFVKQEPTLTDGLWKKDILCYGKTLNFLLQKKVLRIHSLLCECVKCSTQEEDMLAQKNDDECYVCHSEGDLVCCDECPRAFHSHCHLPAVHGDSPGEWICTLCVLRNNQQWRDTSNMSEKEAFNAPVSQYILHCHYLLLCVYRKDIQKVFVEDPRQTVRRYSKFITEPMWLDRIKQKLDSRKYQTVGAFVSDFQLIFSNCSMFNKDNEFGRMGARLKQMFEEEFRKIFKITEEFTPKILRGRNKDKHKIVYRFVCPYAGQFRCSLTRLVFVMESEGEVLYNTVSWDPCLLVGLGVMQPAGPLYDINCFNGSISGLHLPHCEMFAEDEIDCLAVAHFTGGNVAIMNPLEVTEAYVKIDIHDLSLFGLIKRIFSHSPVIAQVLIFLRPITEGQEEKILDVHLLPWNVPVSEVENQHTEHCPITTTSKCSLILGKQYRLCCQPEESTVQPETEEFVFNLGPNYHPTFEVFVHVRNDEVKLSLIDITEERAVWPPRRVLIRDTRPVHRRLPGSEFVDRHRSQLIQRVSSVMVIADVLRDRRMITAEMYNNIRAVESNHNKMRELFNALDSGGDHVKAEFYRLLVENEPYLVNDLNN
ncbi:uncharacterized protein LOC127953786 isoform X3 [Carassius gibelio]|uniref:uncharacterized protein LOC127953786 isoform X3 n=1 Tax=Carassius gibelio TaxID=101364 RepID=UPI00227774B2|nr:uncharacterized protein LOC127953786 isoform X3 [Carassius gibelio]